MTSKQEPNFEKSMEKLNQIVDNLESGDLDLDESLKLYEEGIQLSQACAKRLEKAQTRIDILMRSAAGEIKVQEVDAQTLKPKGKKKKS